MKMLFSFFTHSIAAALAIASTVLAQDDDTVEVPEDTSWQLLSLNYSTAASIYTINPPSGQLNFQLQRSNITAPDFCQTSWQWDATNLHPLGWRQCSNDLWFRIVTLIEGNRTVNVEVLEAKTEWFPRLQSVFSSAVWRTDLLEVFR